MLVPLTQEQIDSPATGGGQRPVSPTMSALTHYWHAALRWRWVVVGLIAAAVIVGVLVTLLMTPQYTATSRIEISRDQKKVTNVEALEQTGAGDDAEFYQTQYALLTAHSLAVRVANELRLAQDDSFFAAHRTALPGASIFGNAVNNAQLMNARQKLAVELLENHITISPVRNSALVDVRYTSASPKYSSTVVNAWVKQFIAMSADRRFASTADARQFLERRLADLRVRLEKSERDAVNYASQKGIVATGSGQSADGRNYSDRTIVIDNLNALNQALAKATAERIEAESQMRANGERGVGSLVLSNDAIAALRSKRADVSAELARMSVQFQPDYPPRQALKEQLAALDASLAREEGRVQASIAGAYREMLAREQSLQARVESLKNQLSSENRESIQYNIYRREADTNRQLYDGLLQRYKEIGVAGVGVNNISVVDIGQLPEKPSSPRLLLNLAIALVAGFLAAAAAVFVLDQLDEGLHDPEQVTRELHVPLIGSVPDVEVDDPVAVLADPKSVLSEAYLTIRSSLAFSTAAGLPRSLMVTSTREAEGKTTTSCAIAAVLSRTGKKVLLLDADMRSPSLNTLFSLSNKAGLSNMLAGDDNWAALVQRPASMALDVVTTGPKPPSAAELLSSDRMKWFVASLLKHYDHVVIDAPPLLGLADAVLLSQTVEGTIYVVEANRVPMRGIRATLGRLRDSGAHLIGVIVTKLGAQQSSYGYGYGYGYSYGNSTSEG